jgi:hypothetical protein
MSMVYQWKAGSRVKADAAEVGALLEGISERDGSISPEAVVDAGREEDSPIHGCFEWDNEAAADKYRIDQARYIIRSVTVKIEDDQKDPVVVRAFVEIRDTDTPYVPLQTALSDTLLRRRMIAQAIIDLTAFERKYRILTELAAVFEEAEKARKVLLNVAA